MKFHIRLDLIVVDVKCISWLCFLCSLPDREESDWDQPLPAGNNGWRSSRLLLLGACVGQAVSVSEYMIVYCLDIYSI